MTIRALVFDAYGTLYDVQSVLAKAETLCPGKGEVITQIWRLKQLEYTWLRSLMGEYEDFWGVTGAALDFALRAAGVEPDDAIREPLMENYLHLDPYPDPRPLPGPHDLLPGPLEFRQTRAIAPGRPPEVPALQAGHGCCLPRLAWLGLRR